MTGCLSGPPRPQAGLSLILQLQKLYVSYSKGGPMTLDIEFTKTEVNASIHEVDFQKPDTL